MVRLRVTFWVPIVVSMSAEQGDQNTFNLINIDVILNAEESCGILI